MANLAPIQANPQIGNLQGLERSGAPVSRGTTRVTMFDPSITFSNVSGVALARPARSFFWQGDGASGTLNSARIQFTVSRSMSPAADRANVRLYNLPATVRREILDTYDNYLDQRKEVVREVRFSKSDPASFATRARLLRELSDAFAVTVDQVPRKLTAARARGAMFSGDIERIRERREGGVDTVLELDLGDLGANIRGGLLNRYFENTSSAELFRDFATEVALSLGADPDRASVERMIRNFTNANEPIFKAKKGFAAFGTSIDRINEILATYGARAFVQDKTLYFTRSSEVITDLVSVFGGQVNALVVDRQDRDHVAISALLTPPVRPGQAVWVLDDDVTPGDVARSGLIDASNSDRSIVLSLYGVVGRDFGIVPGQSSASQFLRDRARLYRVESVIHNADTHGQGRTAIQATAADVSVIASNLLELFQIEGQQSANIEVSELNITP